VRRPTSTLLWRMPPVVLRFPRAMRTLRGFSDPRRGRHMRASPPLSADRYPLSCVGGTIAFRSHVADVWAVLRRRHRKVPVTFSRNSTPHAVSRRQLNRRKSGRTVTIFSPCLCNPGESGSRLQTHPVTNANERGEVPAPSTGQSQVWPHQQRPSLCSWMTRTRSSPSRMMSS
jgi:hypothetical protein